MLSSPLAILAALCLCVAASEWLERRTVLKHLGAALLVIVMGATLANLGVIPTYQPGQPVYDAVFSHVAPAAIFWLLLQVNLRGVLRAGPEMLGLFLLGSLGTVLGVAVAMRIVKGGESIGPLYRAVGGMYTGTYIGGSINFNAIALHYDVAKEGALFAAANAVDNIATTAWMAATLVLPRLLSRAWPRKVVERATSSAIQRTTRAPSETSRADDVPEPVGPIDVGVLLASGLAAVWASDGLSRWLRREHAITVPSILILTTLALIAAQIPSLHRLKGARSFAAFALYLFLAVVGALCDLGSLRGIGTLGLTLMVFVTITILVHGIVLFAGARLLRADLDAASIASQANIGGPATALALSKSLGRADLELPAVLAGLLGYAIGTYAGFATAEWLL